MARPTKFDAKKAEEICGLVAVDGAFLTDAAALVGVHVDTVRKWIARGRAEGKGPLAEFAVRYDKARATFTLNCQRNIRKGAKNSRDLQWLLNKLRPNEFGDRVAVHLQEGLSDMLDRLESGLEPELFERVVQILSAEAGPAAAGQGALEPTTH